MGHPDPDPDPYFENRIRESGSEKNGPDPQHWLKVRKIMNLKKGVQINKLRRKTLLFEDMSGNLVSSLAHLWTFDEKVCAFIGMFSRQFPRYNSVIMISYL